MFKFQSVLFFLAFTYTAHAQTPLPISAIAFPSLEMSRAKTVTDGERVVIATYSDGSQFVAYKDGNGATALVKGTVYEINAQPHQDQLGEWWVVDTVTGDYFILNTYTGVTVSKTAGMYGVFVE